MRNTIGSLVCLAALGSWMLGGASAAANNAEPPLLAEDVAAGKLPPMAERLPKSPYVDDFDEPWLSPGQYGGRLKLLMGSARDVRQMVVYGYARLVGFDLDFNLFADVLEKVENEGDRVFTLHLRPGHKWSDGHPFTTEDFRYWWEDVANNKELSPAGPPVTLLSQGQPPTVEILDETRVRYTWPHRNPTFLPHLAQALPVYIYAPSHYMKQFHPRYADQKELDALIKKARVRSWGVLHLRNGNLYKNNNPKLPTLQPWYNVTTPPSDRFLFKRNPYFHRVDRDGRQLPYIDEVVLNISENSLIPAKTGTGETDLQARYIRFDNFTFLKEAEARQNFTVRLWRTGLGSRLALFLNMNVNDDVLRDLFRNVRFRRALSLAINRTEINQAVYYGLGIEGNNTVLPDSKLFKPEYQTRWAEYDPDKAQAMLDDLGLDKRNKRGVRLLPDGRPMELIVETAGESTEETDVLELIRDSWAKVGIKLFTKPSQREVFRNRIYAGDTQIAAWSGITNGFANPRMEPTEFAPVMQDQLQWPKWGQHFETKSNAGEPPALEHAQKLLELFKAWHETDELEEQTRIWHEMLEINANQVFTIGTVAGIPQPVVISNRLHNLPEEGIYNWDPGAYFGLYHLDRAWLDGPKQ